MDTIGNGRLITRSCRSFERSWTPSSQSLSKCSAITTSEVTTARPMCQRPQRAVLSKSTLIFDAKCCTFVLISRTLPTQSETRSPRPGKAEKDQDQGGRPGRRVLKIVNGTDVVHGNVLASTIIVIRRMMAIIMRVSIRVDPASSDAAVETQTFRLLLRFVRLVPDGTDIDLLYTRKSTSGPVRLPRSQVQSY